MGRFEPEVESVVLVQVANRMHRSIGIRQSGILGSSAKMQEMLERQMVSDVATITALLITDLGVLFVLIARPKERVMLWFGTTAIVLGVRHGLTAGAELLVRLGLDLPWPVLLRVEYLLGAVALTVGYLSVLCLVREPLKGWWHRGVVGTGVALSFARALLERMDRPERFTLRGLDHVVSKGRGDVSRRRPAAPCVAILHHLPAPGSPPAGGSRCPGRRWPDRPPHPRRSSG